MALARQQSLFPDPQGDLFPAAPAAYKPKIEHVRNRLNALLVEARAAAVMPWSEAVVDLYRGVFRQLTPHLPEEEAVQYRHDFETELLRLGAPQRDAASDC
jgi:hypothetical protein